MGKSKAQAKTSPSTEQSTSYSESLFEEIWAKIQLKLNEWIENTLPPIARNIAKTQTPAIVEEFVSKSDFINSISDSLQFDLDKMDVAVERTGQLQDDKQDQLDKMDDLEQYTRRTNLRIYGIPEAGEQPEDTDQLTIDFAKSELGVEISPEDISRSHRVGKRSSKPRPIIVRLVRHNTKVEILRKRRQLKKNKWPYNIQEDLTKTRRDILKYLRNDIDEGIIDKVWTADGVIFLRPKQHTSTIETCSTMAKCCEIIDKYSY